MALFSTILISTIFCYGRYWWRRYGCLPTGTISSVHFNMSSVHMSIHCPFIYLPIWPFLHPPTSFINPFVHVSIHPVITFIHLFIYGSIQLQLTTAPTYFHFPSSGRRKSEDKYDISRYDSNCLILILSKLITISIVVVYSILNNY